MVNENLFLNVLRNYIPVIFLQSHYSIGSFGDPILNQVKEFMMKVDDRKILSSNFQLQDFNTDSC